ncbi:hypothetical protein LINPERHAP2_LOCUS35875 [Linum perenne]
MVADHYVVCEDWWPYFRPEESSLSTLRVWVRLPGIPLEYFDYSILKRIGDRIGKTVRIDHITLEGSRGNFARLCVEVDLSRPLLSKYHLRRRVRRIEYEGLHTICFQCGCYGDEEACCPEKEVKETAAQEASSFSSPIFGGDGSGGGGGGGGEREHPEEDENFGPWMQVKRQPCRSKAVPAGKDPMGKAPPAGKAPVGKAATACPTEEGKYNNGFNALRDLGESGDGEEVIEVTKDCSERPADLGGDKENIPQPEVNAPQTLLVDESSTPHLSQETKTGELPTRDGPAAALKGLGDKTTGPIRNGGAKSGDRPVVGTTKPKEKSRGMPSRGIGRGGHDKARNRLSDMSGSDQAGGDPRSPKTDYRSDQLKSHVAVSAPHQLPLEDVLMTEANVQGGATPCI